MLTHRPSPFLQKFIEEKTVFLEKLWPSAKAFSLSSLSEKNLLIITEGKRKDLLYQDISFFSSKKIIDIPSWNTFFSEDLDPSKDIIGERMQALKQMMDHENKIVLAPLPCVLQKIPLPTSIEKSFTTIKQGQKIFFDRFLQDLVDLGYERHSLVIDKGQFAVRGGIIDLFPVSHPIAVRIEFFGDEIEQIRTFDIADQRSVEKISSFFLSPASEQDLVKKTKTGTLLDYLHKDTVIVFDDLVALEEDFFSLKSHLTSGYLTLENFWQKIEQKKKIFFAEQSLEDISQVKIYEKNRAFQKVGFEWLNKPFSSLRLFSPFLPVEDFSKELVTDKFSSYYVGKKENKEFFPAEFIKGSLSQGLVVTDIPLIVYVEDSPSFIRRQVVRQTFHAPASTYQMLAIGDPVVHTHSGIGRFLGIEKQKNLDGTFSEFIALEYAEKGKLFVPLSQSHLVSRYIGSTDTMPTLSKLGSKKWENTCLSAKKQIVGYAKSLLEAQAERVLQGGFAFPEDSVDMLLFEENFPYQETPDQLAAIASVKNDMQKPEAMDRLILGDVGYGKTEVALRATFKAAFEGKKQVAILVPTTALAMQHYENFTNRLKEYPLVIEAMFRQQKNPGKILEKLQTGQIDILIGTHRILSKDIYFKDLGLLIIDEEQRFGVRAKEHLKKFKKGVDCLTLSATPIPRTLYMSIIQIKDMSTISTPPYDRLPIKTIICENEDTIIVNALLREHLREGQTYFIHNRVETIAERCAHLQKLLPQAKIVYVHGRMKGDVIDKIFYDFKRQKIDILVATTLIENGIDIPNANTIFIDDAQRFGLSDLYQLRGRVGRWNRPAFAYFLIPSKKKPTEEQRMRLSVLAETSGFGGGVKIAMRDLEIRGAGDILGTKQSGQISKVGFHLYCKLLKEMITSIKQKKPLVLQETQLEFSFPAKIPEEYIPEHSLRMEMYHKIGNASSFTNIEKVLEEMQDRFGKPQKPVLFLYHLMRIKIFGTQNFFTHIKLQNVSFTAKQAHKNKIIEKNFMLVKNLKDPSAIEKSVIEILQKNFFCPYL